MKNICSVLLVSLLAALLFAQCKKEDSDTIFNTSFYTSKANAKLSLYIDDTYKGELPYFPEQPACGQINGESQKPLTTQLRSGEYRIAGRDEHNKVISLGTIKISKNKMSSSGGIGGQSLFNSGDCLVIGLFE